MTNNELICGAVASLNIPVAEGVYHGDAEEYIVFNEIAERPVNGDDGEAELKTEYYISYYTREDPYPKKRQIKALLKAAGIGVDSVQVLYDEEAQERWHVVFDCFVLNGDVEAIGNRQ